MSIATKQRSIVIMSSTNESISIPPSNIDFVASSHGQRMSSDVREAILVKDMTVSETTTTGLTSALETLDPPSEANFASPRDWQRIMPAETKIEEASFLKTSTNSSTTVEQTPITPSNTNTMLSSFEEQTSLAALDIRESSPLPPKEDSLWTMMTDRKSFRGNIDGRFPELDLPVYNDEQRRDPNALISLPEHLHSHGKDWKHLKNRAYTRILRPGPHSPALDM